MNYISLAIIALTAVPILFGALLGLLRGSRRALLRLILVIVCVALSFALCGTVTKSVMNVNIDSFGGSVTEVVKDAMAEALPESMSDYALAIAQCLLQVFVFLLLFFATWFLTWLIVFPICKIFVKPKRVTDESGAEVVKKHRGFGALIGAVQGVIVAVCVCIVFTGLLVQTNNILVSANELSQLQSGVETASASEEGDVPEADTESGSGLQDVQGLIGEYVDSGLGKLYDKIGSKAFAYITQVELEDGTKITLSGQIEALRGVVSMVKELLGLQDLDFANLLQQGNVEGLQALFNRLGDITDNLSDEAKATVNSMINSLGSQLGFGELDLDFTSVNFKKEGEIFVNLYQYNNKEDVSPDEIIDEMVKSDIIISILEKQEGINLSSQLEEEQRDLLVDKINAMEASDDVPQEKIDAIRKIFGLTSQAN